MTTRTLDRPATYDDLRGLPPEARAEIFDGVIVMSPGASPQHNRAARYLANALEVAGQPHGYLVNTDNDVQWHPTAVTRPDVCVVAEAHPNDQPITHYPVLVVEVLSPASAARDLVRKRAYCETARVPEYWVVDLAERQLFRHHFVDSDTHYTVDTIDAGDTVTIDAPFPLVVDTGVIL